MRLEPIDASRPSLTSEVLARLRAAIAAGTLSPGSLHSVSELASALGVSRTPVREALIQLAGQGMVRFERNRGIRILATSLHDLEEIFTLRILLEVPGARAAAARATPDAISALRRTLAQMERAARADDELRLMELDRSLHRSILLITGNTRLATVVDSLRDLVLARGASTANISRTLLDIAEEHRAIVEAIARRDPAGAGRAMHEHVHQTGRLLIAQEGGDPEAATFDWLA